MPITLTPFRYPGGKTKLYSYILNILKVNSLENCTYIETFAGGAGLAIKLLQNKKVERIIINDNDYAIYCVWNLIVNNSELLCEFINSVPLSTAEWQKHRYIYNNQNSFSDIEIGLSAFFLNRTNVSGILKGGVIGGYSQLGTNKIGARFNRIDLVKKVVEIAKYRESIDIYKMEAVDFINTIIPKYDNVFIYLDPPYVNKGPSLYKNSYSHDDHKLLAKTISECKQKWLITYDNCEFINELYSNFRKEVLTILYSAGKVKFGDEIAIFNHNLI